MDTITRTNLDNLRSEEREVQNKEQHVTRQRINEYIQSLLNQRKYSPATVSRKQAAIKKYLGWKPIEK